MSVHNYDRNTYTYEYRPIANRNLLIIYEINGNMLVIRTYRTLTNQTSILGLFSKNKAGIFRGWILNIQGKGSVIHHDTLHCIMRFFNIAWPVGCYTVATLSWYGLICRKYSHLSARKNLSFTFTGRAGRFHTRLYSGIISSGKTSIMDNISMLYGTGCMWRCLFSNMGHPFRNRLHITITLQKIINESLPVHN